MKWWPFKRKNSRSFGDAVMNRLTDSWHASLASIDTLLKGSLKILRSRSRQLGRDNPYIKQNLNDSVNNIVGTGIRFQSKIKSKDGSLDAAVNSKIEELWQEWRHKENCDVEGKKFFQDIEALLVESLKNSGEVFVRLVYGKFGFSPIPLSLEVIEADCLDDDLCELCSNGNEIVMGVEYNKWRRPVAYHFLKKHPGDNYLAGLSRQEKYERIPSQEIIHLFQTKRPKQSRGVPNTTAVMKRTHHMDGYEQAIVVRARVAASVTGFIKTPEADYQGVEVQNNQRIEDFSAGKVFTMNPGEDITVPDIKAPTEYEPFNRVNLRGIAAGLGSSYESISRDYSQSNYSSTRQALLSDRASYRRDQQFLINHFHREVYREFLDLCCVLHLVVLPSHVSKRTAYLLSEWTPPAWEWIDPMKEVMAEKEAVKGGFKTLSSVLAKDGTTLEEFLATREKELKMCREYGIHFDTEVTPDKNNSIEKGFDQTNSDPQKENEDEENAQAS